MSRYYRHNPDEPVRHDWTGGKKVNSMASETPYIPIIRWITDSLPESEMTVLVRLRRGYPSPVWVAFHDGEKWRYTDGTDFKTPVCGWMELESAAKVLDAS